MLLKVSVSLSELKFVRSVMSCPVEEDPVHGFKHADPNAGSVMAAESASGSRNLDANVFNMGTGTPLWNPPWQDDPSPNRRADLELLAF
jgi:hypothetical protein